ncbi:MAG: DUF4878 domain-containing protein [Pyrinomonadaceae bacterium]
MKNHQLIIIILTALVLTTVSCTGASAPAKPNAETGNAQQTETAKSPGTTTETSAGSPGATIGIYFEALKKKDDETVKKYTSKASLEKFEEAAKAKNKTLSEMILAGEDLSGKKSPETRNEKIDGDSATVEVKDDETGKWETVPLIKEDGLWKIAFEKLDE